MNRVDPSTYPELRQLCSAYLNADFARNHGTVGDALAAYRRETGPGHRAGAAAELERLIATPGALMKLDEQLAALGCDVQLADAGAALGLAAQIRRVLAD